MNQNGQGSASSLGALVQEQGNRLGPRTAYAWLSDDLSVGDSLSFAQLAMSADLLGRELLRSARPGDRVVLAMDNGMEAVVGFWACIVAGLVPIPAPSPDVSRSRQGLIRLRSIFRDAAPALALTPPQHLENARLHLPEVPWQSPVIERPALVSARSEPACPPAGKPDASALAYLQYTSGSTKQPKGVEITHGQVLAQCHALAAASPVDPELARSLVWLPWYHDYGLVHGLIQPMALGTPSYLMSTVRFLLNPLRWLEAIDRHRITHSGGPNFAYAACVQALSRNPSWSADLRSWHLATCGAEPVRPATMHAFAKAFEPFGFDRCSLAPCYGLAEAVVGVTMRHHRSPPTTVWIDTAPLEQGRIAEVTAEHPRARALTGCGPALSSFQLAIVDPETGRPSAPDRVGEIWVAGPSVAQGYWGQPEATRESFGRTLAGEPDGGPRFLRTGDLGFMAQGELFVTGRRKDLIVVNGRNLYPQDLEHSAQEAHPGVRRDGVIAVSVETALAEDVVLLVECQGRPDPQQVRALTDAVRQRVGLEHEVAIRDVVPLRSGSLPRTSSGKLMRSEAGQMYLRGELDNRRFSELTVSEVPAVHAAAEHLQAEVAAIWCEVLGVATAEMEDDFLDQGGDSLMATQFASRIATRLGVDLSVATVFELRKFRLLLERLASVRPSQPAPGPTPDGDTHCPPTSGGQPLSFSQERMWFMQQMAPGASAYHIPLAICLRGTVDQDAMAHALQRVVQRHAVLRTTFVATASGVESRVANHSNVSLENTELIGSDDELREHLAALSQRPFDLASGPLFRAQLIRRGADESVLALVMHHLVSDQWSCFVIGRELAHYYSVSVGQSLPALPELPMQYADYAHWHRQWFDSSRRERELAYWSQQLTGLEPLTLNEDRPRPPQPSFRGASLRLPITRDAFSALTAVGSAHGASLSMVLIAALDILLMRHTGQTDVAIGVPIANRNQLASEHLVGTFVNTLVLRTHMDGNPCFKDVLERVRDMSLEAFAHQDMPFEVLVRELDVRHDLSRAPLFNVMFNMVNTPLRDIAFHGLQWSRVDFDRRATQFDLSVLVDPLHDPGIVLEYATDLFERSTIERMAAHLQAILDTAVRAPEEPVLHVDLIDSGERSLLRQWSRGPVTAVDGSDLGAWLANGARSSPDGPAIVAGNQTLTHQALLVRTDALAGRLRRCGIGPGIQVGICIPRTPELLIALVSLLKAGAAYVPLDPAYPVDRLSYQVGDAGIALMLATRATAQLARQIHSGPLWVLDDDTDPQDGLDGTAGAAWREPTGSDPAYVIYTSGSTGHPKGVVISRDAVLNFLNSMALEPGLSAKDRLLAVTTVSFDIAVLELLLPLGRGATIVLATEAQAMDGRELVRLIEQHNIHVMQATPSRWHLLLGAGWTGRPDFKALVGGEPLDRELARQLATRCGQVWNMYGPTETTVWSTCWRVDADAPNGISLGHPIANTTVHVLDAAMRPCPVGVMGEICIGGQGLALGYHERKSLTDDRFVSVALDQGAPAVRLYRTGDLGRWRTDGSLEHGGRMDDQVKLRGFRIELGEIEARLLTLEGVRRAVVALKDLPGPGSTLVAYLVCEGETPSIDTVRRHLQPWLPEHMVPGHVLFIDAVPVLSNGKTDRKALPLPVAPAASGRRIDLPRNHAEQLVWQAWCDLLGTQQLGIHDRFFDVGGHSMLAIRLAARLEQDLGRTVPLGLIFTHTTIASCAEQLLGAGEIPDRPVAILQPEGHDSPLFLLAGADMYRALAVELAPEVPVYGIFSQTEIDLLKLNPDEPLPEISVSSLAREYLHLVQSIQAEGPYRLGGFSIGGVIAHEVAQLLRESGQSVQLLLLLDCALPGRSLGHLIKGLRRRWQQVRRRGWKDLLRSWAVLRQESRNHLEAGQRRINAYAHAIRQHEATPGSAIDGKVLFLQAGDDPSTEPAYGWTALIPGIVVERTPGRHMDILEPPHVAQLVERIRRHLNSGTAGHAVRPHP